MLSCAHLSYSQPLALCKGLLPLLNTAILQQSIEYRRQWRKLHIGIDAKTLQIRAVQLTTNNVSDSQVLGDLLAQIPLDERIDSVYTDGAYDTKQCRQVIADRQAHAVIPPRKNAKPWKDRKRPLNTPYEFIL